MSDRISKKIVLHLQFTSLILLTAPTVAAQTVRMMDVTITQQFAVNRTVYPAGTYRFAMKRGQAWVQMASADGSSSNLPVIDRLRGPGETFREGSLVFDSVKNDRVLAEIWLPGEGGLVVSSMSGPHEHHMVMGIEPAPAGGQSGRGVYEHTCLKCHGPQGNGNEAADKFFGLTIPRLNSTYVQAKPDAEIRSVITEGRGNMDAVRMGQASVRHLLSPDSVAAVVSYVRTFKR